ncbi:MAG: tRNA preQ1(34) S-adenosylmethionine ribosyltransferase-isomerase QueA [Planctomycetota bacterium]
MTQDQDTRTSAYHFDLPAELIAQAPLPDRAGSRMMVVEREGERIGHRMFRDLPELLPPGCLLVLNDTRVVPARLRIQRPTGGAGEVLLVRREADDIWQALARPAGRLRPGDRYPCGSALTVEIVADLPDGLKRVRLIPAGGTVDEAIEEAGEMPLPPYIKRKRSDPADRERYQTVYATTAGSSAAPTAGLHFTPAVLDAVRARGIEMAHLTLHVGPGTFLPVRTDNIRSHRMHAEWYTVGAALLARVRERKRPVVAVGTTALRALESAVRAVPDASGGVTGETEIFIHPRFEFKAVEGLLTNFHLPESTLIMLVAALAGREFILKAYAEAVREKYRFFSYGDCMLIR